MALSTRDLTIGLVLIVVGLIADFGASYLIPAPPACNSPKCDAAEFIGLAALLLLILGVAVQVRALSNARPGTAFPVGFRPGEIPPPAPLGVPAPAQADWAVPRSPTAPFPAGPGGVAGTGTPPVTVRCRRCGTDYPMGLFGYCSKCGSPLPFAPGP